MPAVVQLCLRLTIAQCASRKCTLLQGHSRPTCQECPVSVLDDLRAAEQRVAKRLKELEPAVAEYRELEEVAQRLGIDAAATGPPSAPKAAPRRRRTPRAAATS